MSATRRSTRISSAKKPIALITISSSEDDEPLPRQQELSPSAYSDDEPIEVPVITPSLPSSPVTTRTPPRAVRQPVRSSSTDPRPSRPQASQPRQQARSASQPASEPRVATSRRRLDSSSSSAYSPNESSSSSSSSSLSRSSSSSSVSDSAIIRPPKRVPVLASSSDPSSSPPTESQGQAAQISSQTPPGQDRAQTETSDIEERARRRKLALDKIIGAVKHDQGVDFVVKWKGLTSPEKIPLKHLRILFPREVVDFMCKRIKWLDSSAATATSTSAAAESSESQMSTTSVS